MEKQAPLVLNNTLILFFILLLTFPTSFSSIISSKFLPTKSGYLPVNSTSGSSIFYAFYEAQKPISHITKTPLLIWLEGGPGCSSMTSNLHELGPWRLNYTNLVPNEGAWNRIFGVVFLDNPIGTGFSVAATFEEIPRDQQGVANHLFIAIKTLLELNPSFKTRPLYVTGQSYAGKYVPAVGYYILNKNREVTEGERLNLCGIAIGNGLTDPVSQIQTVAPNAYYNGLINEKQRFYIEEAQKKVVKLARERRWSEATDARNALYHQLQNMTGLATLFNMERRRPYGTSTIVQFLNNFEVKKALGVNPSKVWSNCNGEVQKALYDDGLKSTKYMVEVLVKESKVLLYQGILDLQDGVVSNEAWMKKMRWEGIGKFQEEDRKIWRVNGELAGYVQKWGSLSHVVVLGAGHIVPTDQPLNSQAMIEDWVLEKGVFANQEIELQSAAYNRNVIL